MAVVGRTVMPQSVVEGEYAAVPEQPETFLDILGVLSLVRVDENHVIATVTQSRQHTEGGTGNQPEPLGGNADAKKSLACCLLMFWLDVNAGQDAVRLHASEQR
jgi:hypothetical protein